MIHTAGFCGRPLFDLSFSFLEAYRFSHFAIEIVLIIAMSHGTTWIKSRPVKQRNTRFLECMRPLMDMHKKVPACQNREKKKKLCVEDIRIRLILGGKSDCSLTEPTILGEQVENW